MNEDPPPPSPPDAPRPESPSAGAVAGRAVLGFLTFALSLWLPVATRQESVVPAVVVVIAAICLAISGGWRGFALGVFIGVGLALLLVGICLATFKI